MTAKPDPSIAFTVTTGYRGDYTYLVEAAGDVPDDLYEVNS